MTNRKKILYIPPENINDNSISILEKIRRLTELQDPDLMDADKLQYFAGNLGYNVNINRAELGNLASLDESDVCPDINTNKYLRFAIRNLPLWYRIKTTQNSMKIMLYSFGLIGDISQYYTDNYLPSEEGGKWITTDVNQETYSISNIPKDYYPTPHFIVWINLDLSSSDLSWETDKRKQIIQSIESIRPANTVFRRLGGYTTIPKQIGVTCSLRFHSQYKGLPVVGDPMYWYNP